MNYCLNLKDKENKVLADNFGEVAVAKAIEDFFDVNNLPTFDRFVGNAKVKQRLGIVSKSDVKGILNRTFKSKEISPRQLQILKKLVSKKNTQLAKEGINKQYRTISTQVGQSLNYKWAIREIDSSINIDAKIERQKQRARESLEARKQIKDLEDSSKQLTLFDLEEREDIVPNNKSKELDSSLKSFLTDLGINVEVIGSLKERYGVDALGAADMLRKAIVLARRAGTDTLTEETAHIAIAALGNNHPAVAKALSLIEDTEVYEQVRENYAEQYGDNTMKYKLEALGKVLTKVIKDKNDAAIGTDKPSGFINRLKRLLDTIVKVFKKKFSKAEDRAIENRIESIFGSVAADILSNNTNEFDVKNLSKQEMALFALDPETFKDKKIFKDKIKSVEKALMRNKQAIDQRSERGGRLELLDSKMEKAMQNNGYGYAMALYLSDVGNYIDDAKKHIDKVITSSDNSVYSAKNILNKINKLRKYTKPKKEILEDLQSDILSLRREIKADKENVGNYKELKSLLNTLNKQVKNTLGKITTIERDTYELGTQALREEISDIALAKFRKDTADSSEANELTEEQFIDEIMGYFETGKSDINVISMWIDALSDTNDEVLGIMNKKYKDTINEYKWKATDKKNSIINMQREAAKDGVVGKDFFELDSQGNKTRYVKSEVRRAEFESNLSEIRISTAKKYLFPEDAKDRRVLLQYENPKAVNEWFDKVEKDEYFKGEIDKFEKKGNIPRADLPPMEFKKGFLKFIKKRRNTELAKWFEKNTEQKSIEEIKRIKEDKKKEIFESEVTEPVDGDTKFRKKQERVAEGIYQNWLDNNTITYFYGGEEITKYTGELSQPKVSVYADKSFESLSPAKKKHLKAFKKTLEELDKQLPWNKRLNGRMPQVFGEDATDAIKDPKRYLADLKNKITKVTEGTLKSYEHGVIDENGDLLKEVPVAYTNNIKPESLSENVYTSLVKFMDGVYHHQALTDQLDLFEFTKDVIDQRTYEHKAKNYTSKLLNISDQKPKANIEGGNAAKRFNDFIESNFYQKRRLEGATENMIDTFSKYVALNNLALNMYAGTANIILGGALTRVESIAAQFYNTKDLAKADLEYTKHISGIMGDIGSAYSTNKLRLVLEHFDFLQDHKSRTHSESLENSRFNSLFNLSSMFFINNIGEHMIQSRTLLATLVNHKVKSPEGKEMNVWEALTNEDGKGNKTNKLTLIEGLKNLDGSDFTMQDIRNLTTKAQAINRRLHGIYNPEDINMIQKSATGRAVMMFRKWFRPTYLRNFGPNRFDYEIGDYVEGNLTSVKNLLLNIRKEAKEMGIIMGTKEVWNNLKPHEKANMYRTIGNMTYFLAASTLAGIFKGLADDETDEATKNMYNFMAYQALRFNTELWSMTPGAIAKLISSPAAGIDSLEQIIQYPTVAFDFYAPFFEDREFIKRYKSGEDKDSLKAWKLLYLIPPYKAIKGLSESEQKLKFFTGSR